MEVEQGVKILNTNEFQWCSNSTMKLIEDVEINKHFIVDGVSDESRIYAGIFTIYKKSLNGFRLIAKIYSGQETAIEIAKLLNQDNGDNHG